MSDVLHFATCPVWVSGLGADCNCQGDPAWRIRKDVGEQFPWRIYRRTADQQYEPLMRCSSFQKALALVQSLNWLHQQTWRGTDA